MSENINLEDIEKELEKELLSRNRDSDSDSQMGSGIMPDSNQARIGVLVKLLTAVQDEKEYRQALLTGDFLDDDEADRVAAAIEERRRYGITIIPILDWCAARCGVNRGGHGKSRAVLGVEGLTHSSLSLMSMFNNKKKKEEKEN